jgi:hypothetical protein
MVNYFYSDRLAERIKALLDEHLPDEAARNISVGDFSVLPDPDEYAAHFPAVVISADEMENIAANASKGIFYTPYHFTVYYFYPYTFDGDESAVRQGKRYAEAVANVLMNLPSLDGFEVECSETEAGGMVVASELSRIRYDSAEQAFFRELGLPLSIAAISFSVDFRTYAKEANY